MLAGRVVEHLDVVEHILARFVPCSIGPAPDPLALEQIEEALGHGIVMAVAAPAHGVNQIVVPQEAVPIHAGELGVFNRLSQHQVIVQILDVRSRLQLVSSNRGCSGACCSACELRLEYLGLSTATGRCPSGSIAAKGVGVLVGASLPWTAGSCKEDLHPGLAREPSMVG